MTSHNAGSYLTELKGHGIIGHERTVKAIFAGMTYGKVHDPDPENEYDYPPYLQPEASIQRKPRSTEALMKIVTRQAQQNGWHFTEDAELAFILQIDGENGGLPISAKKWRELFVEEFGPENMMKGKRAQTIAREYNPNPKREHKQKYPHIVCEFVINKDAENNGEPISAEDWGIMLRANFGQDCEMDGRSAQKLAYRHNPGPKRTMHPESIRQFVKVTDAANNGEPISAEEWGIMLYENFGLDCGMDGRTAQKLAYDHNPIPKSKKEQDKL